MLKVQIFYLLAATIGTYGKFSEWNSWSACSSACGSGRSARERILIPHGGEACYSAIIKDRSCYGNECPRTGNLASGKTATSSSNIFNLYPASKANDGNKNNLLSQKSCMHTEKDPNPWLRFDLQVPSAVQKIIIYNRNDCCADRLNNLYVTVGYSPDGTNNAVCGRLGNLTDVAIVTMICSNIISGKYVHLRIPGPQYLHVCEVEIMGSKLRELSRGRGTILSSTLKGQSAGRAIDNNPGTLAATNPQLDPYFRIDLAGDYYVNKVTLHSNGYYEFNSTLITVGDSVNGTLNARCTETGDLGKFSKKTFECDTMIKGRYLQLTQLGLNQLAFSEIYVQGY